MRLFCFLTSDGELPAVLQAALPCDPVGGPAPDELARVLDGGDPHQGAQRHVAVRTRLKRAESVQSLGGRGEGTLHNQNLEISRVNGTWFQIILKNTQ